jgi:hypothetical protein
MQKFNGTNVGRVLGFAFFLAVFVFAPMYYKGQPATAFFAAVLGLVGMVVITGLTAGKRILGALINERYVMSLSRFQAVLWTVLVVAAYAAIALPQIAKGVAIADIFKIAIQPELLALMGISYGSAVGSSMLSAVKTGKTPQNADGNSDGVLFKNTDPSKASIFDIFEGDEIADQNVVDISKVQMFFFTAIGAAAFISSAVNHDLAKNAIPLLPDSLLALMGVSHAAYLGGKLPTKTAEAQPAPQPQPQPADPMLAVKSVEATVDQLRADSGNWVRNNDPKYLAALKQLGL